MEDKICNRNSFLTGKKKGCCWIGGNKDGDNGMSVTAPLGGRKELDYRYNAKTETSRKIQ